MQIEDFTPYGDLGAMLYATANGMDHITKVMEDAAVKMQISGNDIVVSHNFIVQRIRESDPRTDAGYFYHLNVLDFGGFKCFTARWYV